MNWINVKRKLPRVNKEVLAWVIYEDGTETFTESWLDADGTWAMGSAQNYRVTHWMNVARPRKSS
jgi:uncharacterized protein YaeQ